jgi:hypothetical protein
MSNRAGPSHRVKEEEYEEATLVQQYKWFHYRRPHTM